LFIYPFVIIISMNFFLLFPYYFSWHYTRAIKDMVGIWFNFVWFIYNFFSIKILAQTLFSPIKRLKEGNARSFDIEKLLENFVVNFVMRVVGFFSRASVIFVGLLSVFLTLLLGVIAFLVWLSLPIALVFVMLISFVGLF